MCGISDTHGQIYYPTSEMMTGRCSIGCPGTSPSLNWCLKSWREILLTPFFSTHSILVFHGGDVFTDAKTVGMLSTAVKAPEISTDLFRKMPTLDWVQTESQWDINFLDLIISCLSRWMAELVVHGVIDCVCKNLIPPGVSTLMNCVTPVMQTSHHHYLHLRDITEFQIYCANRE